jgi:heptosyltransferase-2
VLGLPAEIKGMRRVLPQDRGIEFLSGTLEQALIAIARARVVLALDSGAAHFAQFLNVPGVAIFGKSDPETIIGTKGSVVPIYEKKFACQPCGKVECNQPEVYCMNTITPETVAQAVCNLLAPSERAI